MDQESSPRPCRSVASPGIPAVASVVLSVVATEPELEAPASVVFEPELEAPASVEVEPELEAPASTDDPSKQTSDSSKRYEPDRNQVEGCLTSSSAPAMGLDRQEAEREGRRVKHTGQHSE